MKAITRNTATQAYQALFSFMLDRGEDFTSEDGAPCLIAPGRETIIVHINNPLDDLSILVNLSPLGAGAMDQYMRQLVYGENIDGFDYTYWERIHRWEYGEVGVMNQEKWIKKAIINNPNTRRAVSVLWNPESDVCSENPPCLNHIKLNVWNGMLNMAVLFRSHDLIGGWIPNVYALIHMLNKLAGELAIPVGWLEVISEDGHFYKNDQDKIDKIKAKLGM